jgi:hypothetical protein
MPEKGFCDNQRSYWFSERVDSDFQPEECGMRKCGSCIYFVSDMQLKYEAERADDGFERLKEVIA